MAEYTEGPALVKTVAKAFRSVYDNSDDLKEHLPGGLWFTLAKEDINRPYGVFTWDGSEIDEICGGREDRLETVRITVSLYAFGDDGGEQVFDAADAFMAAYDWATLVYNGFQHIRCQRVATINQGLLDNIWQVDIEYELEFAGRD